MFERWMPAVCRNTMQSPGPREWDDLCGGFLVDPLGRLPGLQGFPSPVLDMRDEGDRIVVTVEVPGMDPKEMEVTIEGDLLTLKGEKLVETEQREEGYLRRERRGGAFIRSVSLPCAVDQSRIKATCDKGVLTILLPKNPALQPKRITVQG